MNLSELRNEAWDIARETASYDVDRLWRKAEMDRYINRVYRRIARETRCIRDAEPSTLTRITVAPYADYAALVAAAATDGYANDDLTQFSNPQSWFYVDPSPAGTYAARLDAMAQSIAPYVFALDRRILDIDEVKWTSKQWRLNHVSVKKWQVNPYWEQIKGMPTEYCTDYSNNTIAINFRADTSDTLRLQIRRMPLADLVNDPDEPVFRIHYHDFMVNGILWQMYSKQDAQAFDMTKAEEYRQAFMSDIDEIKQQEVILDQMLRVNFSMDAFR